MDVRFLWLVTITTRDFRVPEIRENCFLFLFYLSFHFLLLQHGRESACYSLLAVYFTQFGWLRTAQQSRALTYIFLFDFYSILFQRATSKNPVFDAAFYNLIKIENAEYIITNACYLPCRKNRSNSALFRWFNHDEENNNQKEKVCFFSFCLMAHLYFG